jgi:hypothetical protein
MTSKFPTKALIQYWRQTLIESDFHAIDISPDSAHALSWEEIKHGRIAQQWVGALFSAEEERQKKARQAKHQELENHRIKSIEIVIAPLLLKRGGRGLMKKQKVYCPLYVPAKLMVDGSLLPATESPKPWIPRQMLEPALGEDLTIGTVEDFDMFLTKQSLPDDSGWEGIVAYGLDMFKKISGKTLEQFCPEEYVRLDDCYAMQHDQIRGAAQNIINLYDYLLKKITKLPEQAPLFQTLIAGKKAKIAEKLLPNHRISGMYRALNDALPLKPAEVNAFMKVHTGQMRADFGLAISQRQALVHILHSAPEDLVAVNGPPGTGKTTLLQSVIASLWVDAAFEQSVPPIILGCSTNNQAVFNILDSFSQKNSNSDDKVALRWLPTQVPYGLSFPSGEMLKKEGFKEKYVFAEIGYQKNMPWKGLPSIMEERAYVKKAELHYIACAEKLFSESKISNVKAAVEKLHAELAKEFRRLKEILDQTTSLEQVLRDFGLDSADVTIKEIENIGLPGGRASNLTQRLRQFSQGGADLKTIQTAMQEWLSKVNVSVAAELIYVDDIHQFLDRTLRFRMFSLAARYWEGRWILEVDHLLESKADLGGRSEEVIKRNFRRWAMITPCFISTLHMVPKIFSSYLGKQKPLLDFIDMLIVDEAGQISPEVGSAAFALAKRSTVVGDIHQIEPVPNVTNEVDVATQNKYALDSTQISAQGLDCSNGSIMRIAQQATTWTLRDAEKEPGLFLSEHRRCKNSIIAFCNDLVYQNRLDPCTENGSISNGVTPMIGYAHLAYPAVRRLTSWGNPGEARVIATWISEHQNEFVEKYKGKRIQDIVAIVTPYRPQTELLRQALRDQDLMSGSQGLTVGTVHALQGAERPIVLFSPVVSYGPGTGRALFDKTSNMLNVAVSRAKDSFLVFGDMRLFDPSGNLPSSVLAKHLFRSEGNEVVDVLTAPVKQLDELLPASRIDTLQRHRDALKWSIENAKEKLLITSPYLSIHAVQDDDLLNSLTKAVKRGVNVLVITSVDLNRDEDGQLKKNFVLAESALQKTGCRVVRANRVHNKTLAVDDGWLIEGSFNWLSAVRDGNHSYSRREISFAQKGNGVTEAIDKEWEIYTKKIDAATS